MTEYYKGKVKVIGNNMMCFPADPVSLEPISCGCYDPWAWSDPDKTPIETLSIDEWNDRRRQIERRSHEHHREA